MPIHDRLPETGRRSPSQRKRILYVLVVLAALISAWMVFQFAVRLMAFQSLNSAGFAVRGLCPMPQYLRTDDDLRVWGPIELAGLSAPYIVGYNGHWSGFDKPRPITDEDVLNVRKLRSISCLEISFADLTDDHCRVLSTIPVLHSLRINGNRITDLSLYQFAGHPTIQSLVCHDTPVTLEAALHFMKQTPSCEEIVFGADDAHYAVRRVLGEENSGHSRLEISGPTPGQ